jgi:shikimate kinase
MQAFPIEAYVRGGRPVVLRADYRDSSPGAGRSRRAAPPIDGREWLVEQAIPAFRLFTRRALPVRFADAAREAIFKTRPDEKSNIALVGFMGSGKTATGRALARALGWELVDADAEIEARAGMPIQKIFATRGEPVFRGLEKSLIAGFVPAAKKKIFSLGGGAVLDEDTRALVARRCRVIWLWTSLETALSRIEFGSRPVLDAAGGDRAIERAYRCRFRASARAADLVLSTDGPSPDETAERIRYEMDQAFED